MNHEGIMKRAAAEEMLRLSTTRIRTSAHCTPDAHQSARISALAHPELVQLTGHLRIMPAETVLLN